MRLLTLALPAARYDGLCPVDTGALFDKPDHTHTKPAGATFHVRTLKEAIRNLSGITLGFHLLPETRPTK